MVAIYAPPQIPEVEFSTSGGMKSRWTFWNH